MSLLKNIYRKNFCPLGKRLLLEVFDARTSATDGLVLQETGLPAGTQIVYQWWKEGDKAWFEKSERNLRTASESSTNPVERLGSEFDDLITLIEQVDQPHLGNFAGAVKDGVVFAVAWGDPKNIRHLSIRNPESESRHDELVRTIKANEWGEAAVTR